MSSTSTWRADPARKLMFMFSGQGTHYYGMGRELYRQVPSFRRHLDAASAAAHAICGVDVVATIYDDKRNKQQRFDDTLLTHPAIYVVEVALARTLIEHGVLPDAVLGVSMGNFAAATVAGSMEMETALAALHDQARAINDHAEPGAMLALLGPAHLHQEHALLRDHTEIAALSTPSSFILALPHDRLDTVEALLRAQGIHYQRMAVSRAFHSRWIDRAAAATSAQATVTLAPPQLPWWCATHAAQLTAPGAPHLWQAVRQPIRMAETLAAIAAAGQSYDFLDLGPSGSLALLLKYLLAPGSAPAYAHVLGAFGSDSRRFTQIAGAGVAA